MTKNGRHIVIIGVYAPSDDAEKIIKDHFYDKLFNTFLSIKDNNKIFILDMRQYGEATINDNGKRHFCENSSQKIMNGYFPHKDIHKYTWIQLTKGLHSKTDYIIQKRNSTLRTIDVRVYRSAECGSDHHMVVAKVAINYRITNTAIPP